MRLRRLRPATTPVLGLFSRALSTTSSSTTTSSSSSRSASGSAAATTRRRPPSSSPRQRPRPRPGAPPPPGAPASVAALALRQLRDDWNEGIALRAQPMVLSFLASQFAGWCACYPLASYAASGALGPGLEILGSPELAAAFLVTRLTRRLRMPVNLALASGVVANNPELSTMKVTPLVTGMTEMDKDTTNSVNEAWARVPRVAKVRQHGWGKAGVRLCV